MARIRNVFIGLLILGNLLAGCVTVPCDPDNPTSGKDCYECARKATLGVQKVDPDTGHQINNKERIKVRTEECLRERGYVKQKKEVPRDRFDPAE